MHSQNGTADTPTLVEPPPRLSDEQIARNLEGIAKARAAKRGKRPQREEAATPSDLWAVRRDLA